MEKKSFRKVCIFLLLLAATLCANAQALGDANNSGTIDIVDALVIAQYSVGLNPANFYASAADVNADASINIVDALLVAQYFVGIITQFPGAGTTAPTSPATVAPTTAPTGVPTIAPTTPPGGPTGNLSWLHTSGRYILDANNNQAAIYGVAFPDLKVLVDSRTIPGDAGKTNIQRYIDRATNASDGWYANVMRLAVYPETFTDETGSHTAWKEVGADNYFNTYLNPAVEYCIQKQVYVIIDWHYVGASWTNSSVKSNTDSFWSYVAPKYSSCSNVIFELMNEPGGNLTQSDWNSWKTSADAWVNIIRQSAPDNLILVGAPSWSQNLTYVSQNPVNGSNIVYVCHIYPQHSQSNWDSWFGNTANSYPVFISEWGYEQGAPNPCNGTQSSYGDPFKNYLNSKNNIRWTAWVFDYIWRPVMWDNNWNLRSGSGYMGQFVKTWLDEKL